MNYQIEMKCGHVEEFKFQSAQHESIPIEFGKSLCLACAKESMLSHYVESLKGERVA